MLQTHDVSARLCVAPQNNGHCLRFIGPKTEVRIRDPARAKPGTVPVHYDLVDGEAGAGLGRGRWRGNQHHQLPLARLAGDRRLVGRRQ